MGDLQEQSIKLLIPNVIIKNRAGNVSHLMLQENLILKHCKSTNIKKWSWRESNPRPNKQPMCFLHAYFVVDFGL